MGLFPHWPPWKINQESVFEGLIPVTFVDGSFGKAIVLLRGDLGLANTILAFVTLLGKAGHRGMSYL